ncbi:Cytochrome P450 [Trinorchestia longiramus]|nr:Cytochrome P450 [Trinorchestia longiramus]
MSALEPIVKGFIPPSRMQTITTSNFTCGFGRSVTKEDIPPAQGHSFPAEARQMRWACFDSNEVTAAVVRNAKYTSAAIKESMRLNPISIGIGRVNASPIVLRDYHIPAGTTIVSMNQHIALNPLYFSEPEQFRPERFMEGSGGQQHHSHALLPFGQGSRMCIARSIARQTLQVALMHMVNEFSLTWEGPALGCTVRLINEPDGPLSLLLAERR